MGSDDQDVGQLIRSNVSHLRAQLASISRAFVRSWEARAQQRRLLLRSGFV